MALDEVDLLARLGVRARARVRPLGERRVVWVELSDGSLAPPLTAQAGALWEVAVRTALRERIPLVTVINSAGADNREGIAALAGWGRVARTLTEASGVIPTIAILDGPAVSGPALLLGMTDLTVATEGSYASMHS